jgi:hypothetical protein
MTLDAHTQTSARSDIHHSGLRAGLMSYLRSLFSSFEGRLGALGSLIRDVLAGPRRNDGLQRLDQLDEHHLRDVGLVRVEEIIGWRVVARGAAPVAVTRYSYQLMPGSESRRLGGEAGLGQWEGVDRRPVEVRKFPSGLGIERLM